MYFVAQDRADVASLVADDNDDSEHPKGVGVCRHWASNTNPITKYVYQTNKGCGIDCASAYASTKNTYFDLLLIEAPTYLPIHR